MAPEKANAPNFGMLNWDDVVATMWERKPMSYKTFIKESGFKMLAVARLEPCEYSVVLYVLNCAASGLDAIETSPPELAITLGWDVNEIRGAIQMLSERGIVVNEPMRSGVARVPSSMRLSLQYDVSRWHLKASEEMTGHDAVVFPFRKQATVSITEFRAHAPEAGEATWKRVFDSFVQGRSLDRAETLRAESEARVLVDTHPVDQILLMLRHFGERVPSLSLLASSWGQFQQLFEEENHKVDLAGARQRNSEDDGKVRQGAADWLARKDEVGLTEEEATVLKVLTTHRFPRRQLFWAYQMRARYPKLAGFFADFSGIMLGVTSKSRILKRPKDGQ
jgi:hypothetical protein